MPLQSESLADFWARRWNLVTTYMMRVLVYEPIMEGAWFSLRCGLCQARLDREVAGNCTRQGEQRAGCRTALESVHALHVGCRYHVPIKLTPASDAA
jgi:hypothetical protein